MLAAGQDEEEAGMNDRITLGTKAQAGPAGRDAVDGG